MTLSPKTNGLTRALGTFALALALAQAAIMGLGIAFPDFDMPSSIGLAAVMISALMAGQGFAKTTNRALTGAERLRFALGAAVISVLVGAALVAALMAFYGVPITLESASVAIGGDMEAALWIREWLWVIVAVSAALAFIMAWIFVGLGAKTMLKALEKQAAKTP
jgi:hypothetical protein